jgi:hypothetical protein
MAKNNFLVERVARFDAKEQRCKCLRGEGDWLAFFIAKARQGEIAKLWGGWASGK